MGTAHDTRPDFASTSALRCSLGLLRLHECVQSRSAGPAPAPNLSNKVVMILYLKLAVFLLPVALPLTLDGTDSGAGSSGTFITSGTAICNCTAKTANLTVSHQSSVSVQVGNGVSVTAQTGQSGSASQDTPPNKCLYLQYNFECSSGWFGWTCPLTSSSLKQRAVNGDCR